MLPFSLVAIRGHGWFTPTACKPTIYFVVVYYPIPLECNGNEIIPGLRQEPLLNQAAFSFSLSARAASTRANWLAGVLSRTTSLVAGAWNTPRSLLRSTSIEGKSARASKSDDSRRLLFKYPNRILSLSNSELKVFTTFAAAETSFWPVM